MALPEVTSFTDIVWDNPAQRDIQALALMLAYRERCGYAPFVGERDFSYVNGMHTTDALLSFAEDVQNLNTNTLKMIYQDLGHDVWQGWDMDQMIGFVRPASWQYLWWNLKQYNTNEDVGGDGGFINPLLRFSAWERLNEWLLRNYNGYNWDALRSEKYDKVINAKMIGDILSLVNHMQHCVLWPEARSYAIIGTTSYTSEADEFNRNDMWEEMCSHTQSLLSTTFNNHSNIITLNCPDKGYNESINFQMHHVGEHKILNVFGYDADIYAHVRFKGDWDFNTGLHKGINHIGLCKAGEAIQFFNIDVETLKTNPPPDFHSIQSGQTIKLEMAIDWVMFDFSSSFQYSNGENASTFLSLPDIINDD